MPNSMNRYFRELNDRELATVTAALRLWAETDNNIEEFPEYFTEYSALTPDECAALIDRLNSDCPPRVLVRVEGGVAEVTADEDVETLVLDFDNDPNAVAPPEFAHLAS